MRFHVRLQKWVSVPCACILLTVLGMGRVYGQATGTIVGTVTDMSGAGVAGVLVQVNNSGTGVSQSTATDPAGRFRVPDLVIGTYELEATYPGFQTVVHRGITLTVGSEPVVDFSH